jgi:ubiquinone/menaquinone biosynthesis C-methylase UbiE
MTSITADERFWDRMAEKYARDPIKDMAGYERTLTRSIGLLKPSDRVLEFACGTGTTALKLAPHVRHVLATDISSEMIAIAQGKANAQNIKNVSFEKATLDHLAWADEAFEVVVAYNALHMVHDLQASLQRIFEILKPGGLFISKTPCLRNANIMIQWFVPLARMIGKAPHVGMFTSTQLRIAMVQTGFEVSPEEKHGSNSADFRSFFVARKPHASDVDQSMP